MVMPERRERVVQRLIEDEMRESFLDYSMSVIVQRALPDVRDGLKPVHRRILYAMRELGLLPGRPFKKSATVVGEVLGKYHPHGDSAVYDALVRMVQDFSMRYPLVDGQGNFGSVDGDSAAAYRYTEARLTPLAVELLAELDMETVSFSDTFDGQRQEPVMLPARLPNLLVNGSSGIAVGMATNVPPHNLREVAGAVRHLLAHPECTVQDLMRFVPGPDFPTGGFIMGAEGIRSAYETGRGRMVMRARVQKESKRGGREQLVVTELPFGVSKSRVIEQVAEMVKLRRLEDVADLRDESDRDGMRIVVELKRGVRPARVLNLLYKHTHLQTTFGAIMLALDNGVPYEFSLKEMLERYRDHRLDVIRRRARHQLDQARAEAHLLEGLLAALGDIDAVVSLIRKAKDRPEAVSLLRERLDISKAQADAILHMRLARLTALERRELRQRLKQLHGQVLELEALLGSAERQQEALVRELDDMVERFGDVRRTTIVSEEAEIKLEDLIAEEDVVVTLSHEGYVKRIPMSVYRRRIASGLPLAGMERYEEDFLEHVFIAGTRDTLLFFTKAGQAHALPVHEVPEGERASRGRSLGQILGLGARTEVAAMVAAREFDPRRALIFLTAGGMIKRTTLDQFSSVRAGGIHGVRLRAGDELLDVQMSDGGRDLVLVTGAGRAIRFPETDVPLLGRNALGVRGIRLRSEDQVVGMVVVRRESTLCTITEKGYSKRTAIADYPVQRRGGLGTMALAVSDRTGRLVAAKELIETDELMIITAGGMARRLDAAQVLVQGRATQGKQVAAPPSGDRIVEVSRVVSGKSVVAESVGGRSAGEEQLELIAMAGDEGGGVSGS